MLARLNPEARPGIVMANLHEQGVGDFGSLERRGMGFPVIPAGLELFYNDEPMPLARYPNEGFLRIAGVPEGDTGAKITFDDERPGRWLRDDDIHIMGYWRYEWAESYERVRSIDPEKNELTITNPPVRYGFKEGTRFYFLNVLEELDAPGEWYLDRDTGNLFFYPPAPADAAGAVVSLLEEPVIVMRNTSHVTVSGVSVKYCRGTAVRIEGGMHTQVAGCAMRNIGNNAVEILGGIHNGVLSCDISETGDGGIILDGGDRITLAAGNHFAENNHIHHFSRWSRTYRPAVSVQGVGNSVRHNLIHDAPHSAILLGGNDHTIEYNEIFRVALETSDVGAFYMGRNWTTRGNAVRFNYFYDLGVIGEGVGTMAIYIDDQASGVEIFGNVVNRSHRAIMIGGGRDNSIENNVFIDCDPVLHLDARGLTWQKGANQPGGILYENLRAIDITRPPYSTRYPKLATMWEENNLGVPVGNTIERNVVCTDGEWVDFLHGMDSTVYRFSGNHMASRSEFVDLGKGDLRLRPGSTAFEYGFKEIPYDRIGLYRDEYRKVLPEPE